MARLVAFLPVAFAGGCALLVAGCSADPTPIATETPSAVVSASPTPTPSASPSPTALTPDEVLAAIPENARGEDFQSASEFAKFFIKEYERMFAEADPALFALVSAPECDFCASSLSSYEGLVGAGGRREGGVIEPSAGMLQGGLHDDGFWYVVLPFSVSETRDYDATGAQIEVTGASSASAAFQLAFSDGHWVVVGVEIT